jgi:hypothetical protein
MEVTNAKNHTVIMSQDGSKVRLLVNGNELFCKKMIIKTNYLNLYLVEVSSDDQHLPFRKEANVEEMSIPHYINNQDDFLYHRYALTH